MTEGAELAAARRELAEQKQRLAFALEATGIGLWSWDAASDRIDWDEATCAIFGRAVPTSFEAYLLSIHPDDRERAVEHIARALRTGKYDDFELRIVRPDGAVRCVAGKGRVELGADGAPKRLVGGILDVTDTHRLREELSHTRKLEAVGQLAAGVAHNFNNLLTVVLANIELSIARSPPELLRSLQDSRDAVLHAADLVRQLTLFAGKGRRSPHRDADCAALVERTVEMCRATFQNDVRIELEVEPELGVVLGDAAQIEQVLLNLLLNARDAFDDTTEDRRITVSARSRTSPDGGRMLELCVADNGMGMSEAVRERATEPFFTTKQPGQGTGLGLSSAYAIVTEHGGRLTFESRVGAGTTARVELPGAPPRASEPGRVVERVAAGGDGALVLVVDDEPDVRRVMAAVLSTAGYRVLQAGSGAEALDLVTRHADELRLVVLDQAMPGQSGKSVLRELRARGVALPVLGVTGSMTPFEGTDHALQKPMTADELLRAAEALLASG